MTEHYWNSNIFIDMYLTAIIKFDFSNFFVSFFKISTQFRKYTKTNDLIFFFFFAVKNYFNSERNYIIKKQKFTVFHNCLEN